MEKPRRALAVRLSIGALSLIAGGLAVAAWFGGGFTGGAVEVCTVCGAENHTSRYVWISVSRQEPTLLSAFYRELNGNDAHRHQWLPVATGESHDEPGGPTPEPPGREILKAASDEEAVLVLRTLRVAHGDSAAAHWLAKVLHPDTTATARDAFYVFLSATRPPEANDALTTGGPGIPGAPPGDSATASARAAEGPSGE